MVTTPGIGLVAPTEAPRGHMRILLVEDNPGDADLIHDQLSAGFPREFDWVWAKSLSEGLQQLAGVDLVLLDLSLADATGLGGFRAVRAAAPRLPIVVITGYNDQDLAVQATEEGAQDYLVKGRFDADTLGRTVRLASERQRMASALHESEERYRLLFDENPLPMWFCDAETGRFLAVNGAAQRRYGYTRDEFLDLELSAIQPEGITASMPSGTRYPSRHRTRSGAWLDVESTAHWLHHRARLALLLVIEDVTERKRLEREFHQAEKMEAVGRLAGGIAHDFNNVLMAIQGYVSLGTRRLGSSGDGRRELNQIETLANRAAALVRQLLAFSRRQVLQPTILDLDQMIHELQPMLASVVGERIRLDIRGAGGVGRVHADRTQVEQALVSMVINARDAMPAGGTVTLETRRVPPGDRLDPGLSLGAGLGYACVSITDTGVGIAPELRARVFEPFFTTKRPGHGAGLGLSTAYGIVRQTGGEITFETEVGKGTVFRIYLPEATGLAAPAWRPAETPSAAPPSSVVTVVLVEDDDVVREVTLEGLESSGLRVLPASNGIEALAVIEAHQGAIDLVISDIVMPQMDGLELTRRLRVARPGLKVLLMSGCSEQAAAGSEAGGEPTAFLPKPVRLTDLLAKIESLVGRRIEG